MLRRQVLLTLGAAVTGGCLRLSQSENGAENATTTAQPDRATTADGQQSASPESSGPNREPDTVSDDGEPDTVNDDGTDQPPEQSPAVDGRTGEYQFSVGESYTYQLSSGLEDISIEVTEVSGSQLTAQFSGPQSDGRVVEGSSEELFQQSRDRNDTIARALFAGLRVGNTIAEGHSLTVGNSWTVSPDEVVQNTEQVEWETATAEVTGTDSHDGVSCVTVELTTDANLESTEYCLNPEYPFAIAISNDNGENVARLVDHTTA